MPLNHKNAWTPPCGCELHYEFDDALPQDQRVHVPIHSYADVHGKLRQTKPCQNHNGLTLDTIHDHLNKECRTLSAMLNHLLNIPRFAKQTIVEDGSTVISLDPSVQFNWGFTGKDHQRQLVLDIKGKLLTPAEKNTLKALAATLEKPVNIL